MTPAKTIRLGTRSSALARWQAEWVAARLAELGVAVVLVPITTSGDRHQQQSIGEVGGQGLFTKEIQRALLDGQIDLAVHSLKDLPTDQVAGLALAAVPPRAPVADLLVCRAACALEALPEQAVVGTGSLRRQAQLLALRRDLSIRGIRGNVDTRLRKLAAGEYDAVVLAEAGLKRLGLLEGDIEGGRGIGGASERGRREQGEGQLGVRWSLADASGPTPGALPAQRLSPPRLLPAVGQGALGLESRSDDHHVRHAVEPLNHTESFASVLAERAMLSALGGGCLAPVAGWGRVEQGRLVLTGRVLSANGERSAEATLFGELTGPDHLGLRVADALAAQGAAELIDSSRRRA